ncbi:hypothetical protein HOY82DRAFT_6855 [Tuber indicum]|nr:hypothetical protein HOY82DRAFT_6855 [Tuber indicum]
MCAIYLFLFLFSIFYFSHDCLNYRKLPFMMGLDWLGYIYRQERSSFFVFFLIIFLSSFILDTAWRSSFCRGFSVFPSFYHSEVLSVVRLSYYFTYIIPIPLFSKLFFYYPSHAHRTLVIIFVSS